MESLIIDPRVLSFYKSLDIGFVNRILETVHEEALLLYLQRGLEKNGSINIHENFDVNPMSRSTSDPGKGGFVWKTTPEGREFWSKVLNAAEDINEHKEAKLSLSTSVFKIKYPEPILTEIEEYGQD